MGKKSRRRCEQNKDCLHNRAAVDKSVSPQGETDLYISILYVYVWFKGEFRIIIISILNPSIEHCFNGDRIYALVSRFYIKVHLHQF